MGQQGTGTRRPINDQPDDPVARVRGGLHQHLLRHQPELQALVDTLRLLRGPRGRIRDERREAAEIRAAIRP